MAASPNAFLRVGLLADAGEAAALAAPVLDWRSNAAILSRSEPFWITLSSSLRSIIALLTTSGIAAMAMRSASSSASAARSAAARAAAVRTGALKSSELQPPLAQQYQLPSAPPPRENILGVEGACTPTSVVP